MIHQNSLEHTRIYQDSTGAPGITITSQDFYRIHQSNEIRLLNVVFESFAKGVQESERLFDDKRLFLWKTQFVRVLT